MADGRSVSPLAIMSQLGRVLPSVVVCGFIAIYVQCIFRRIAGIDFLNAKKTSWPRGWRLALFILALVISVLVLIPSAAHLIGSVLEVTRCHQPLAPIVLPTCPSPERLISMVVLALVLLPPVALWIRVLTKFLAQPSQS